MPKPSPVPPPCPWSDLDPQGATLGVEHFLTFILGQLGNNGQRLVTTRYLDPFDLKVSEWRTLAALATFSPTPFSRLVTVSSADKALVSRTLQELVQRGLAQVSPDPDNGKRKICRITPAGRRLYRKVMPVAQQRQAELLLHLDQQERESLYYLLNKLQQVVSQTDAEVEGAAADEAHDAAAEPPASQTGRSPKRPASSKAR